MPSTTRSACSTISAGPSSERTPHARRRRAPSSTRSPARRRRRGRSRRRRRTARCAPSSRHEVAHGAALVDRHRRPDLEHLPAPVDRQPGGLGLLGDPLHAGVRRSSSGAPRQWKVMIGPLSSIRAAAAQLGACRLGGERPHLRHVAGDLRQARAAAPARAARRRASRVRDRRPRPRAAAHVGGARPRRTPRARSGAPAAPSSRDVSSGRGVLGALHDRGERAVDVAEDRGPPRGRRSQDEEPPAGHAP